MKDELFIRDNVPMTKEEVRAISLNKMNLYRARNLLDVGAGTGSVSIEACVTYPHLEVTAIEEKELAVALIKKNQAKFSAERLTIIKRKAPFNYSGTFDAIFIGGSGGNLTEILEWCWELLNSGGTMILNFILLENISETQKWLQSRGYSHEETLVQVSKQKPLGKGRYYQSQNPITIIELRKGGV